MKNNNLPYRIDFATSTITITKKFAKEANVLNSQAYKTINQLRKDFPTFQIIQKEIRKKSGKRTYANLTIEAMKEHILLLEGKDSKAMRKFEYLFNFYAAHKGRYAKMKAWYLEQYKNEYLTGEEEDISDSEAVSAEV